MKASKYLFYLFSVVIVLPLQACLCFPIINYIVQPTNTPGNSSTLMAQTESFVKPSPAAITPEHTLTLEGFTTAQSNLAIINNTQVHIRNYSDITKKYFGIQNFQIQSTATAVSKKIGDQENFNITNDDTEKSTTITATLRYITDHVYFWTENSIDYNLSDIEMLCDDFEQRIYPNDRKLFGSEWSPGIDNDVHIYIVYSGGLGTYIGGYFPSDDEVSTIINSQSNMHEMFFVNADGQNLASSYMYSVFAHEFTHMIEYYNQPNTETWWSEGTAQLAEYINGTSEGWQGYPYLVNPNIPLNKWTPEMSEADPYYAGSYLFLAYLYERFGSETMQKILQENATGIDHLDKYFISNQIVDTDTGNILTSNDVYGDWQVANLLSSDFVVDSRYNYRGFSLPGKMEATDSISSCPTEPISQTTYQFGTRLLEIDCPGKYSISFNGKPSTKIVSSDPHSGSKYFWSNLGNESSMTLTHTFDFSNNSGDIQMVFWDWRDLEDEFDYVYILASPDSVNWKVLSPSGCIKGRNSFGCGLTGRSNGWVKETVDLSDYSRQKVTILFDYQTDLALNGEGFLLDDISIPAINYSTDFENDNGGWISDGFVRIGNEIPQDYVLSLVIEGNKADIQRIRLGRDNKAQISINISEDEKAYLIISPISKYAQLPADYSVQILK